MSDIICYYSINNTSTGYFLLEDSPSLPQVTDFVRTNLLPEGDFTLLDDSLATLNSDVQFQTLLNAAAANNTMLNLVILTEEKVQEPVPVVEQPPAVVEEPASSSFLGPISKSILAKFDLEVNEEDLDPRVIIEQLDFPFNLMALAKYEQVLEQPEMLDTVVQLIAGCVQMSYEDLLAEVRHTLSLLRERSAPNLAPESASVTSQDQEPFLVQEPAPQPEEQGLAHPCYCDRCGETVCGIRYKCLQCLDYDLCTKCEEEQSHAHFHEANHVFAKIYKPSFHPLRGVQQRRIRDKRERTQIFRAPLPHVGRQQFCEWSTWSSKFNSCRSNRASLDNK